MDQDSGHGHHHPSQPGEPADPPDPDHTREGLFGDPLPEELREALDQHPLGGRIYIYRTGQLLVHIDDLQPVRELLTTAFRLPPPVELRPPEQSRRESDDRATANLLWEAAGVQRLPGLGAVVRIPETSKTLAPF